MRTRVSSNIQYSPTPLYAIGDIRSTCQNSSVAYSGKQSTMSDMNNSSTFKIKSMVTMSPCSLHRIERTAELWPKRTGKAWNFYTGSGSEATVEFGGDFAGYFAYGLPNQLQVDMENAEGVALISAYAKMNGSDTIGVEQMLTMKQTIGMIRSPFKSLSKFIAKAYKAMAKKRVTVERTFRRGRKVLKLHKAKPASYKLLEKNYLAELANIPSSCWLELRYGMIPLMLDVESHIDYVSQKLKEQEVHGQRRVARAKPSSSEKTASWSGLVGCGLEGVYEPRVTADWKVARRVTAGVVYTVFPCSNIDQLNAHLGLRLADMPATAWELIPLSFVLDWAVNVGDWLKAITPQANIQPLANWVSTIEERETTISGVTFHTYLGWMTNTRVDFDFPSGCEKETSYTRTVNTSLSAHPLIIGRPLSDLHLGDGLALMTQKFVKEVKKIFK